MFSLPNLLTPLSPQNPADPLSTLAALLSLLPQALLITYLTLLLSTREAEILLMFLGQLACEALNFLLKRLIKEDRPFSSHPTAPLGKGYGMPSSHAQFAVFWAVAVGLFLTVRHRPVTITKAASPPGGPGLMDVPRAYRAGGLRAASRSVEAYAHTPWTAWQRAGVSGGVAVVAALVAWSRVYLGYHTVRQVVAGCVAGAGCGAAWFAVTYVLRETGALAWGLETPVARWLRVRDLVVGEDLCQAGWEKWEARRRERERVEGRKGL